MEDLLKNLNIIPPIDIYNATDEEFRTGLWQNWWNWLKPKLFFNVSDIANGWEYSSNVVWWDTTTRLPRYFQLGRVTQPITLCKLPFVAVRKIHLIMSQLLKICEILVPDTTTPLSLLEMVF